MAPSPATTSASAPSPRARAQGAEAAGVAMFIDATAEPTSTLGLDVGTSSYTRLRASLQEGKIPAAQDVRVEEMLNHFRYSYPAPQHGTFGLVADVAQSPWKPSHRLVRIGLRFRDFSSAIGPSATRESMAADAKVEVRWNPDAVQSYRLVGYEPGAAYVSESIEGGRDVAAGQGLTAFYEVDPVSQRNTGKTFGTVVIRHNLADTASIEVVVRGADTAVAEMSPDFRFAVSIIAFGLALDRTSYAGLPFEAIEKLAQDALGDDPDGRRAEFIGLVEKARQNWHMDTMVPSPGPPGWCRPWRR